MNEHEILYIWFFTGVNFHIIAFFSFIKFFVIISYFFVKFYGHNEKKTEKQKQRWSGRQTTAVRKGFPLHIPSSHHKREQGDLVIVMGNPGIFQGHPYPHLDKPLPTNKGGVSAGQGRGLEGFNRFS